MIKKPRIIFMGTPDFAVPALTALNRNGYDVALVVTQPDRPKGRGRKMVEPPVKEAALSMGYDVAQPTSVKTPEFLEKIRNLGPDYFVVVAYGHILRENLLSIPKKGAINIHGSLLPKYRGAAPIHWAIVNGEKETGITTMLMDKGMDTGDMLLLRGIPIGGEETTEGLHDRLKELGADLIIETLEGLESGTVKPVKQDDSKATHAPMLKKTDGEIDWSRPSAAIDALIRGMTPWPGAYSFLNGKRVKIFKARPVGEPSGLEPGSVLPGFSSELRVSTADGCLSIEELQGESGKRLQISEFLKGADIPPDSRMG